jgi:hypothetical protein
VFGNRVAAAGLDRFLHVWDVNRAKELQKIYLKQRMSAILIDEEFVSEVAGEKREAEEGNDDIFSRMEKAVR